MRCPATDGHGDLDEWIACHFVTVYRVSFYYKRLWRARECLPFPIMKISPVAVAVPVVLFVAFMAADIYRDNQCQALRKEHPTGQICEEMPRGANTIWEVCRDAPPIECRLPTDVLRDVVVWVYEAAYAVGSYLSYYIGLEWLRPVYRFLGRFVRAFRALVPGWPPIVGDFLRGFWTTSYGPAALLVLILALVIWQRRRVRRFLVWGMTPRGEDGKTVPPFVEWLVYGFVLVMLWALSVLGPKKPRQK